MKGIYEVYYSNINTHLFTKGKLIEKHLFNFEYGVFQNQKKLGREDT